MLPLLDLLTRATVYDLAQPWFAGMPHHPSHPPFLYGLIKQHGEFVGPNGYSSSADAISTGTHVGTHIDALCHFSCDGKLHGGIEAGDVQSFGAGFSRYSIDTLAPILRRGILLDIAALRGGAPLAADAEITPADLERAAALHNLEIRPGDIVLLRTGWAQYFENPARFISRVHGPGPAMDAARWLSARKIFAAGSDTVSFEKVPDPAMPVHVHLLVDSGIHIIECLNLESLAAARVYEFLFVAAPLKIRGATAAPIRPLALVA